MYPLLLIAFYLSILTFYLGVLIYALPIPIAGLKRWAPKLINDAFFISILTLIIGFIVGFVNYLRAILGGDWNYFLSFIKGFILYRSNLIIFLGFLRESLSRILPALSRFLSIGLDMLTVSLYTLFLLYFLALIVYYGIGTLASLGLTLMSVPFRVARNAGAFILSFALVFYLALPLYPNFMILIASPLPQTVLDFVVIYGDVYSDLGYKITEGFVGIKVNNEYIGPAKLTPDGRMMVFITKKHLVVPISLYFDASSHRFYTNVSDIILYDICKNRWLVEYMCEIDASVKGIIYYSKGMAIHIRPQPVSLKNLSIENNYISFTVLTMHDSELFISIVEAYRLLKIIVNDTFVINGNDIDSYKAYSWVWYNVPGNTYVISVPKGFFRVVIEYDIVSTDKLEPETEHIYPAKIFQSDFQPLNNIIDALAYTLYLEIISSILYLSLLMSITYGLTRLLGGATKLRLIP